MTHMQQRSQPTCVLYTIGWKIFSSFVCANGQTPSQQLNAPYSHKQETLLKEALRQSTFEAFCLVSKENCKTGALNRMYAIKCPPPDAALLLSS